MTLPAASHDDTNPSVGADAIAKRSGGPGGTTAEAIARVPWLGPLGPAACAEIVDVARETRFAPGEVIVAELEAGDEVFILLEGRAAVSLGETTGGGTNLLCELGPGDTIGEVALLTRELRSATVTAIDPVVTLRLERPLMETLMGRFPAIAAHLLWRLAAHLRETEATLETLLRPDGRAAAGTLPGAASPGGPRGAIKRAWREVVVAHRRELPFAALATFVASLCAVRAGVWLALRLHADLLPIVRAAFLGGLGLLFASTGLLLFRFRRRFRSLVAVGYGIGFALIFNELSVFLAFDVFWIDMTHPDQSMTFDPVSLYTRSEGHYAVGIAIGVLLQLTYLRRFYRRMFFVLSTAVRGLLSGGR